MLSEKDKKRGFNSSGYNLITNSNYDLDGYDLNGYDKDGYNALGFSKEKLHKLTGTAYGPDGYDQDGFDINKIHKDTGTKYNSEGYDAREFDKDGIHKKTGKKYNALLCDSEGFYINKFNKYGIHKETGTKYDPEGYDKDGYDKNLFNKDGIHRTTGTKYNPRGYDSDGYNIGGFDKDGIHRTTGTKYDPEGYDKDGFKADGINKETNTLFNKAGYDKDGYDSKGFNKNGVHKETGTRYNPNGFRKNGLNRFHSTVEEMEERSKQKKELCILIRDLLTDKISMIGYRFKTSLSIEKLYVFAAENGFDRSTLDEIKKRTNEYHRYDKSVSLETFENSYYFRINDKEISLKGRTDEIKALSNFLRKNEIYECEYTLKEYMKLFLKGELDFTKTLDENLAINEKRKMRKLLAAKLSQSNKQINNSQIKKSI